MSIVDSICWTNHDPAFRRAVQEAFDAGRGSQMATNAKQASELERLKASYAKLNEQARDARKVILLYRHWEHCSDVEIDTGDEADTETMLIQASFAAQEFMEKWENKIVVM